MQQYTYNADNNVSFGNGNLTVGRTSIVRDYYWDWWRSYPYISSYPVYITEKNKIEQAFKIVQKLMEREIIKDLKLDKFISLVNDVASIL